MRTLLSGHGASRGSALGRARVRLPHALEVAEQRIHANQVEAELRRLHVAVDATREEMHRLRDRLHGALAAANPAWDDETIYQHARSLVGAEVQVITYNEFLPALLGPHAPSMDGPGYDDSMDAELMNEFSTALFRFGHSMISPTLARVQNDGSPAPDVLSDHLTPASLRTVMSKFFTSAVMVA